MGNTILIVDDDKAALGMLVKCFALAGYTIYTAETCDAAILLASQYLPDCFLLDYYIGAGTIAPVCRFIRRHPQLKNAPIVILSGDAEQASRSYESCEADVFIDKAGSCFELLAAVNRQLRRADSMNGIVRHTDLALDSKSMRILRGEKPALLISPEQFRFFSALFENASRFVSEEEVCRRVFLSDCNTSMRKALNMVAYRLRIKLGRQLARRIKCSKASGWVYLQPRDRKKTRSTTEKTVFRN